MTVRLFVEDLPDSAVGAARSDGDATVVVIGRQGLIDAYGRGDWECFARLSNQLLRAAAR